jgi:hypothetical protein
MRSIAILVVLNLSGFTLSYAQHDNTSPQNLRALDFLIGEWNVEVEARLSMNGPWEKTAGKSIIKRELDSTLVVEEFVGEREGKRFLSKTLFAINNSTGKFQRIFIDSPHGVLIDFEGGNENGQFVFDKLWNYANGTSVQLRVIYKQIPNGGFTLENQRLPQNASEWDTTGRMKYSKVKN